MAEIRESDLMLVCVAAAKAITREYNMELNNAMTRISDAMSKAGRSGEVTVARMVDNPIERDVAERCFIDTLGLVLGLEEK